MDLFIVVREVAMSAVMIPLFWPQMLDPTCFPAVVALTAPGKLTKSKPLEELEK